MDARRLKSLHDRAGLRVRDSQQAVTRAGNDLERPVPTSDFNCYNAPMSSVEKLPDRFPRGLFNSPMP